VQFTGTKAAALRGEWLWMARATSSLPVPDSPTTSTVALVDATRATSLYTSSMRGLLPSISAGLLLARAAMAGPSLASADRRRRSRARVTVRRSSSTLKGFET
jgi:hypothetical protein